MLQFTARDGHSWTFSNFVMSWALQKYHAVWQYVRFGSIIDLNRWSFVPIGIIKFLRRTKTPTFILALNLHVRHSLRNEALTQFKVTLGYLVYILRFVQFVERGKKHRAPRSYVDRNSG